MSNGNSKPEAQISLSPVGTRDQPVVVKGWQAFEVYIEQRFSEALGRHDPRPVLEVIADMSSMGQMVGLGLAKALYWLKENWSELQQGGGEFEDEIYLLFGKDPLTTERYIGAWSVIENVEDQELRRRLMERPIQDLIAVWQYQNSHEPLEEAQIEILSYETDTANVRRRLREYSGEDIPSREITFSIRRDGTLEVWRGGNVSALGFIRRDEIDLGDPLRRIGLNTLLRRLGANLEGTLPIQRRPRKKKKK